MAALAADTIRLHQVHQEDILALPAKADAVIYKGALVAIEASSGMAVPCDDAAGISFVGVAVEGLDNTDGANGVVNSGSLTASARYVKVDRAGGWMFTATGTTPKAGQLAYCVDDNTVSAADPGEGVVVGTFLHPHGSLWIVDIPQR
jgi:hypothetical protein